MKPIFPPRPSGKVPPSELAHLEATGDWLVQRKFNGDRAVIHRDANGQISIFSRYGRAFSQYKMPSALRSAISGLNFVSGKEYWLDAELLHERDVVFFDVLQAGRYLFGMSQERRLGLLNQICRSPLKRDESGIALYVQPNVFMAEHWEHGFFARFSESLHVDDLEGLVLRRKNAPLDNYGAKAYEVAWQLRCRKPGPTYNT